MDGVRVAVDLSSAFCPRVVDARDPAAFDGVKFTIRPDRGSVSDRHRRGGILGRNRNRGGSMNGGRRAKCRNRDSVVLWRRIREHEACSVKVPISCPIVGERYGIVGVKVAASIEKTPFDKTDSAARVDGRRGAQNGVIANPHLMVKEHEEKER